MIDVMKRVLYSDPRKLRGATLRFVMLALAEYANVKGSCWPKQSTLAERTGYSIRTIKDALSTLEREGWIVIQRDAMGVQNNGNLYLLNLAKLDAARLGVTGADPAPVKTEVIHTAASDPITRADPAPAVKISVTGAAERVTGADPAPAQVQMSVVTGADERLLNKKNQQEPTVEPALEPTVLGLTESSLSLVLSSASPLPTVPASKASPKKAPPFVLPPWIDQAVWDGFEEMRNKQRRPMTDRARNLVVGKLKSLEAKGMQAEEVLNQSTVNSWQDVYELRGFRVDSGTHASRRAAEMASSKANIHSDVRSLGQEPDDVDRKRRALEESLNSGRTISLAGQLRPPDVPTHGTNHSHSTTDRR